jgi:hypothetical protein
VLRSQAKYNEYEAEVLITHAPCSAADISHINIKIDNVQRRGGRR